jgi:hypothetical protein
VGDLGVSRALVARVVVMLGLALLVAAATVQFGLLGALWAAGGAVCALGLIVDVDEPRKKGRR